MLTTVQRNLAALKLELLREAGSVPQGYVDQLNIAIAHLNDAAQIIQGVCIQVEPSVASMDAERLAERAELEQLRRLHRTQPEEPIDDTAPEPEPRFDGPPPPTPPLPPAPPLPAGINPNATSADAIPDLIPQVNPDADAVPLGPPDQLAAEQARASGRLADDRSRQSDPAEEGWG